MISALPLFLNVLILLAAAPGAVTGRRPPDNGPNQIICRQEALTGSRVSNRRVCRTRAEWSEHRREYRTAVERAQDQSQTACGEPMPC